MELDKSFPSFLKSIGSFHNCIVKSFKKLKKLARIALTFLFRNCYGKSGNIAYFLSKAIFKDFFFPCFDL